MKIGRIVLTILLIGGLGIAWTKQITNITKQNKQYEENLAEAEEYMKRGLFQKSIGKYEDALEIRNEDEVRERMVEVYQAAYVEGLISKKEILSVLEQVCVLDEKYLEMILSICIENSDYDSAYKYINKFNNNDIKNEKILKLENTVLYSYTSFSKTYVQYFRSSKGNYTLFDNTFWGVMCSNAEWFQKCEYKYINPISDDLVALYTNSNGSKIIDKDGVVQALITNNFDKTYAYSEGIIPVCINEGEWQYYDCENNKYILEKYEHISSFKDSKAVVKANGKWKLINKDNKKICKTEFDDIKLYSNGDYIYEDTMVASQDGKYGLYDSNGELKTEIDGIDADIFLGEYIAYKGENNKWGFVDEKGTVVIEPQYEVAKSFSNGLGAVSNGELWGFINKKGELVIDYQFLSADYFTSDGMTLVSSIEGLYYVIKLRFN